MVEPFIGAGATIRYENTDYPVTIVAVSPDFKTVVVQEDFVKPDLTKPPYSNEWIIEPNPNGVISDFTRCRDGTYVRGDETLVVGVRQRRITYKFLAKNR